MVFAVLANCSSGVLGHLPGRKRDALKLGISEGMIIHVSYHGGLLAYQDIK